MKHFDTATRDACETAAGTAGEDTTAAFLNLRHLKAFQAVARLRSVNQAAQQINLSQPAISQAICRLEKEIGTDLFLRTPSGMRLTAAGERLLSRVDLAFDLLGKNLADVLLRPSQKIRPMTDPSTLLRVGQLNVLQALRRLGNLSEAARELGVTVKSVNRQVRTLEQRLGCQILLRDAGSVTLTRTGAAICRGGTLFFREIDLAHDEIASMLGVSRGQLIVGALPLTRPYLVPKAMVAVSERHENLLAILQEGSYDTLLSQLRNGEIDILVGALRNPLPSEDLRQFRLFDDELCVVARADHPCLGTPPRKVSLLFRYPWIAPRKGSPARAQFDAMVSSTAGQPKVMLEAASHLAVRSILLESDCLALISRHQVRYEERAGQLAIVPVAFPQMRRTIGYTLRASWRATPIQEEFVRELARAAVTSLDHVQPAGRSPTPTRRSSD